MPAPTTAAEVCAQLWALHPDLDRAKTVDKVIAGDPDAVVRAAAVCWMPYRSAIREAARLGANLLVTHEPTFFDHFELTSQKADPHYVDAKVLKMQEIEALGLTILRCHDVWDAVAGEGVADQWSAFLGLDDPVAGNRYMRVHRVPKMTALDFAASVAAKTKARGQATVALYGDPDRVIESAGVGTGCCSNPHEMYALGADLAIAVDDIVRAWIDGEWCHDMGRPLIVVNHGVSEDCAMDSLAQRLRTMMPGTPVHLIRQGCSYREVTAG